MALFMLVLVLMEICLNPMTVVILGLKNRKTSGCKLYSMFGSNF